MKSLRAVLLLLLLGVTYLSAAGNEERLAKLLAESPESDTNQDGVLTVEEARAFIAMKRGKTADASRKPPREFDPRVAGVDLTKIYEARTFEDLPYRFLPPLNADPEKTYPLIVSLHGAGGKGTDNAKNLVSWNHVLADEALRQKHPAFVIVPQAPREAMWGPKPDLPELSDKEVENYLPRVLRLIGQLREELPIDGNRIYVLGASMGGYGSWCAISAEPDLFAAAIPVCGGLNLDEAERLTNVPIWCFHGELDERVPAENSRELFRVLTELGGNMKYTELKGVGHGAAGPAFVYTNDDPEQGWITKMSSDRCDSTPDVWDWLFAQSRIESAE